MNVYPIGNNLTVKWTLRYSDGTVFPLSLYDYDLSYRTSRGVKVATDTTVEDNVLRWMLKADDQVVSGPYSLALKISFAGNKAVDLQYNNAFALTSLSHGNGANVEVCIESNCDMIDLKDAVLQARKAMDVALAAKDIAGSAVNTAGGAAATANEAKTIASTADNTSTEAKTIASNAKTVAEKAATDASRDAFAAQQAAQTASDHITSLQQAIAQLPDGQAVTEKVAEHTIKLTELESELADAVSGYSLIDATKLADGLSIVSAEDGSLQVAWVKGNAYRIAMSHGERYKISANAPFYIGFSYDVIQGSTYLNKIDGINQNQSEVEFTYSGEWKYAYVGGTDVSMVEAYIYTEGRLPKDIEVVAKRIEVVAKDGDNISARVRDIDSEVQQEIVLLENTGFLADGRLAYVDGGKTYRVPTAMRTIIECDGEFTLGYSNAEVAPSTSTYLNVNMTFDGYAELCDDEFAYMYISAKNNASNLTIRTFADNTRLYIGEKNIDNISVLKQANRILSMQVDAIKKRLDGMLSAKTGKEQTSVSMELANTNEQKLILNLHKRADEGVSLSNDIFLPNAENDFSDVRVKDQRGNYLKYSVISRGNYDIVPMSQFRNPSGKIWQDSKGGLYMIGTKTQGYPAKYIEDSKSWYTLPIYGGVKWGIISFISKNDTMFVSMKGKLYRSEYPYETKEQVLNIANEGGLTFSENGCYILSHSICQHPDGELFLGSYQGERYVRIFKSTDDGRTWNKIYSTTDYQHVHNIMYDKNTDAIYAGLDESNGVLKTTDKGATWENLRDKYPSMPIATDYGVIYGGNGFRLLGGETATNGGNSIIRTEDDQNFEVVLSSGHSCYMCDKLGDILFAGLLSADSHLSTHIVVSYDSGKTWETAYSTSNLHKHGTSDGFRYVQKIRYKGEEVLLFGCQMNDWMNQDSVMVYQNKESFFSQIVVDVPYGTTSITIEDGYFVENTKPIYNDIDIQRGVITEFFPYDGMIQERMSGASYIGNFKTSSPLRKFASYLPDIIMGADALILNNSAEFPLVLNTLYIAGYKAITLSFWLKVSDWSKFEIFDGIEYNKAHILYNGTELYAEWRPSENTANKYDIVLDFSANKWMLYVNGNKVGEVSASLDAIRKRNSHNFFNPTDIIGTCEISEFKIFNRALSDDEINSGYYCRLRDNNNVE